MRSDKLIKRRIRNNFPRERKEKMTRNFFILGFLLLKAVCDATGFNYSELNGEDGNNRDGKFLFDTLFGLELEEELINSNDATNSLKSCDCGE